MESHSYIVENKKKRLLSLLIEDLFTWNKIAILKKVWTFIDVFGLSIYLYFIRRTYSEYIFCLFKNSYIRIFSNEKLILK